MSLESEDPRSLDNGSENSEVALMKQKICYTRDFLLSLGNLDICKTLPSGFDRSLISEFEDTSTRLTDRPRFPGSFPLQGFRRIEYGSSPPTRADSGSYSRGTYGKWENRLSAQSDLDSDSQSDRDSDSGRRYSQQPRRTWQTPEHDGLLGSGSFPRPSGYSTGIPGPKVRANEHNQLNRSNEPYHPPRPYKAVPHLRRDTDSYNDETFGSIDSTSSDRAEEERRRRASFEMMRKEQQRTLQEKQKLNLDKQKAGDISDLSEVSVDGKEDKELLMKKNESVVSAAAPISINESETPSSTSQSPALRPLVPPGFKSNSLEKSFGLKSHIHPPLTEVESMGKTVTGDGLGNGETNIVQGTTGGLEKQQSKEISVVEGQPADKNVYGSFDVPIKKPFIEDQLAQLSSHVDSLATHNDSGIPELSAEVLEDKSVSNKSSTSILEEFFGSTLSLNDNQSSLAENLDGKPDDSWLLGSVQSSKFAQWFFEEETKVADDTSSASPDNLLSLMASGNKANGESSHACANKKEEAFPTILTCEDLEQSILSEYSTNTTKVQSTLESGSPPGANTKQPSAHVDDHASLHLLSMLQKNTDHSNMAIDSGIDANLADNRLVPGEHAMEAAVYEPAGPGNPNILPNSGKTLTLETLFGTAFMKELKSVEAPVSVKRGSIDSAQADVSEPPGLAFPTSDNGLPFPTTDKSGLQRSNHDYSMPSNNRQHIKLNEADNWVGVDGTSPANLNPIAVARHGGSGKFDEFRLLEEDNLISLRDTQMQSSNSINDSHFSSNAPINIAEKLAALVSAKDNWGMEGSDGLPLARDPYKQMEPEVPRQTLRVQQSMFQPAPMTQLGPLYPHLETHPTHLSSQTNILSPDTIFNHDSLASQQFSSSMIRPPFQHPNVRVDVPPQHPLLHQMQMPGNRPPHMLPDFPRGGPLSHHINQATGFIQEVNQMQGFPFGPHQPNIGSRGIPMPGNPPEAFQKLIEMELRANSKQIRPFAPSHSQGVYGHEVDMDFPHR